MIIKYDKFSHLIFIYTDRVWKKLRNARLTFQNIFESNEEKLIQLATLNKTENSYRCFLCKILNKHSKWQPFQFNKAISKLIFWCKSSFCSIKGLILYASAMFCFSL